MYLYRALFKIVLVLGLIHAHNYFIDQQGDVLWDALFGLLHEVVKKGHPHEPLLALVGADCFSVAVSCEHAVQREQLVVQEGLDIKDR